ncbi:hypothetical protein Terro_1675 [Terriglobus roseus DSM 18391]|uniref:Uncharacterized protein n=1 Tax=Terriglobus roseus (strain DSM 18391 / NRRL B-41598 / KBS 63) TaxID=926566 RepID=I3ZFG0_TERRK|nr:hypothetical protein Terro_1675 [Terriglobus roseus DSM 18391]
MPSLFLCVLAVTALPAMIGTYVTRRRLEKYSHLRSITHRFERS